jgi:pyrimidine-nucleoside phosphorylase
MVDDPDKLPRAKYTETVGAPTDGYIEQVHALEVGHTVMALGGGRAKKGDPIDHSVGVEIHRQVGDQVKKGDPLFTIHANDEKKLETVSASVLAAHRIVGQAVPALPLFYDTIGD